MNTLQSPMPGRHVLKTLVLALLTCVVLSAAAGALPDNAYQRWEVTRSEWYSQLFWAYERIHFDPRPIDIAILGSSKTLLGIDSKLLEKRMAEAAPLQVANLSILGPGRNAEWAIAQELFKTRSPKFLVVGVDDERYPWGHVAFREVASRSDIVFPPEPLLKNYFKDLSYLPQRQLVLFAARFAPGLTGLSQRFDPNDYPPVPQAETVTKWNDEGNIVDRDAALSEDQLDAEIAAQGSEEPTRLDRILTFCCNDGDDHAYLKKISELASRHNTKVVFIHMPRFRGAPETKEKDFLKPYGVLIDGGPIADVASKSRFFESWRHLNRQGAARITDYLADRLVDLEESTAPPRIQ